MLQAIVVVTHRPNVVLGSDMVVETDTGSDSSVGTGIGSDSSVDTDTDSVY